MISGTYGKDIKSWEKDKRVSMCFSERANFGSGLLLRKPDFMLCNLIHSGNTGSFNCDCVSKQLKNKFFVMSRDIETLCHPLIMIFS